MKLLYGLVCAAMFCVLALAQAPAAAPADAAAAASPAAEKIDAPVPVPEPSEKAMQFYHSGNKWWFFGQVWDIALPALLLFTGFSGWLRRKVDVRPGWWVLTLALFWIAFSVITSLINLPLDYLRDFARPHEYGLSDQALSKFLKDWALNLVIGCVVGAAIIWIPYLLLGKLPRTWWIFVSALSVPFLLLQMFIWPIFIDPLFNDFGPMTNKALEAKILAIADRAGIEGARVYEVNKSVDTKMVNAYVTGFAGAKRIVLWDTLLAKLDEDESLFVMAHEMGHYVLNHVIWTVALAPLVIAFALGMVQLISGALIAKFGARFGFSELSDPAALPMIMLITGVLSIFLVPAVMAYSRCHEHEADRFALEITHDNHSGATAFVKLQQENLSNPRPDWFVKVWRGSHPTLGDRIDFCNDYHPWKEGKPGKYDGLFKAK